MSIVDALDRLFGQCQTRNQLNALLIKLEVNITPQELADLWRTLFLSEDYWQSRQTPCAALPVSELRDVVRAWLSKFVWLARLRNGEIPQPFICKTLGPNVKFYTDDGDRRSKSLLVGFTGQVHRLLVPVAAFLQAVPAQRADVLILQDPHKDGFRRGIPQLAESFQGLFAALPRIFEFHAYERSCTIGTSGGGLPAVLGGIAMGANIAMSVGGNSPRDPRWNNPQGPSAQAILSKGPSGATEVISVFGADHEKDRLAARELSQFVRVRMVEISDPRGKVGHNAILPIVQQGQLAEFLQQNFRF